MRDFLFIQGKEIEIARTAVEAARAKSSQVVKVFWRSLAMRPSEGHVAVHEGERVTLLDRTVEPVGVRVVGQGERSFARKIPLDDRTVPGQVDGPAGVCRDDHRDTGLLGVGATRQMPDDRVAVRPDHDRPVHDDMRLSGRRHMDRARMGPRREQQDQAENDDQNRHKADGHTIAEVVPETGTSRDAVGLLPPTPSELGRGLGVLARDELGRSRHRDALPVI